MTNPAHDPELVPPGTRCVILTGRYSYRGSDRLDITRQGCDRLRAAGNPCPGEVLAPSHAILWPAKRALEKATTDEARGLIFAAYRASYISELRDRYRRREKEFRALLEAPYQTLVCFCVDERCCHRVPAAEALAKIGGPAAYYFGECEPRPSGEPMRVVCVR